MSRPFHAILQANEATESKFGCSFEEVANAFQQLPRMFVELDGSFVWVIESGESRHQLDGLLVDDGSNLLSCELKGTCNREILDRFLMSLGWPAQSVTFQIVEQGTFLAEHDFRRTFGIE